MDIEKTIEKIKRQITIGECEKNIGIPVYISDLKTVLNELEKKDKEISSYENAIHDEILKNKDKEILKNEEISKLNKVINEMAKFIAGLDIDELICKDREHCTGDYEYETCEECIKEYFIKKAENVGE